MDEIPDPRGGRNVIRSGDIVRVSGRDGERGFLARFRYAVEIDGEIAWVEVFGGCGYKPGRRWMEQAGRCEFRSLPLDRIRRVAQTARGEARFVREEATA